MMPEQPATVGRREPRRSSGRLELPKQACRKASRRSVVFRLPACPPDSESTYYFYWVQVPAAQRDRLAMALREEGVYTTFRYYPLHRIRRYQAGGRLPQAEAAAERTLCLPLHQGLSDRDVERVIRAVGRCGRRIGA